MPSCTLEQLEGVITAAVVAALDGNFEEAKHPRSTNGEFGSGGGGGGSEASLEAGRFEEDKHPRASDGKFGSGGGSGSHASEKPSDKSGTETDKPEKSLKESKALHALELPVKVEHAIGHAVKSGATSAIDYVRSKLSSGASDPGKLANIAGKIGGGVSVIASAGLKTGLKVYFASWVATQSAVKAVAKEKGLSEADATRVQSICSCYDAIACKAVFLGLEHSSLKHLAGASLFVPTASVCYLAYSAARNPIATSRAAAGAVKAVAAKFKSGADKTLKGMEKIGLAAPDVDAEATASVGILANAIKRHSGDDWFFAVLPWAMELAGNAKDAVALAEATVKDHAAPADAE